MVLFGKEIKLDTNIKPKEAKLILLVVSLTVIVLLSTKFIVFPIIEIRDVKNEIIQKSEELNRENINLRRAEEEYSKRYAIYQEQFENYNKERERFELSSLNDETNLKYMISHMAEYLNINILEIGRIEISEENIEYSKKNIPYRLEGNINDLAKFFYYLENSNYLISFKDSSMDIQFAREDYVGVRINIGAYFSVGERR